MQRGVTIQVQVVLIRIFRQISTKMYHENIESVLSILRVRHSTYPRKIPLQPAAPSEREYRQAQTVGEYGIPASTVNADLSNQHVVY